MMESDSIIVLKSVTKPSVAGPPPVISWPDIALRNESSVSAYNESGLTYDMRFNDGHLVTIVTYSILMVISAIGNITVLSIILKRRRKASTRIHAMLMHLAIADLLVSYGPSLQLLSFLPCVRITFNPSTSPKAVANARSHDMGWYLCIINRPAAIIRNVLDSNRF